MKSPPSLSFVQVNDVLDSWMILQTMPNYADKFGVLLLRNFFDMYPDAVSLFSFRDPKATIDPEEFFQSRRFLLHTKLMMRAFCGAIDMLGPDLEILRETIAGIGRTHKKYGLTKQHYSFMELALIDTLQELLGDRFTQNQKMAWEKCWKLISYTMQHGNC